MYRISLVIQQAKLIERILREDFYAEGNGLVELTRFLQNVLPAETQEKIRLIAHARNQFAHDLNLPVDFKLSLYLTDCQEVQLALLEMRSTWGLARIAAKLPRFEKPENHRKLRADLDGEDRARRIEAEIIAKRAQVEALDSKWERAKAELETLDAKLASRRSELDVLESELADLRLSDRLHARLAAKEEELAKWMKKAGVKVPKKAAPSTASGATRSKATKARKSPASPTAVKKAATKTVVKRTATKKNPKAGTSGVRRK